MREAGERERAKVKEYALASGAKPRLEERVRERGRQPTDACLGDVAERPEAARRRAIEAADNATRHFWELRGGGRE